MKSTAKELALGGMFTALGVVFLCLGGIVPLALYACPILASAVLLPVRENCRRSVVWSCYAAIAVLGTLLGPDKESALLFVFLGYYPIVKPRFDAIRRRPLRLAAKLLLAIAAVGAEYAFCCSCCGWRPSSRSSHPPPPPSSGPPPPSASPSSSSTTSAWTG